MRRISISSHTLCSGNSFSRKAGLEVRNTHLLRSNSQREVENRCLVSSSMGSNSKLSAIMLKLEMIPALWAGAPESRKAAYGVPCNMRAISAGSLIH